MKDSLKLSTKYLFSIYKNILFKILFRYTFCFLIYYTHYLGIRTHINPTEISFLVSVNETRFVITSTRFLVDFQWYHSFMQRTFFPQCSQFSRC